MSSELSIAVAECLEGGGLLDGRSIRFCPARAQAPHIPIP